LLVVSKVTIPRSGIAGKGAEGTGLWQSRARYVANALI
jgi:hypothetical protein